MAKQNQQPQRQGNQVNQSAAKPVVSPVAPSPKPEESTSNVVGAPPSSRSPAIDVLASTGEAAAGEGTVVSSGAPPPPASEQKENYREHQKSWESKAEKAAKAAESEQQSKQPLPNRKIPGKFRKFQNL